MQGLLSTYLSQPDHLKSAIQEIHQVKEQHCEMTSDTIRRDV